MGAVLIPDSGHGFAPASDVMRRRWDYFVTYLLDAEPPHDYVIQTPPADVEAAVRIDEASADVNPYAAGKAPGHVSRD
jgi:hypothetical protein